MIDLTEQWKKGELSAEWYYIKFDTTDNIYIAFYEKSEHIFNYCGIHIPENEITAVLAPISSYDEWFKIKTLASLSESLQEKNIECLHRENKVKELLKECKQLLMLSNYENMAQYHEVLELRDKINKIIGEK